VGQHIHPIRFPPPPQADMKNNKEKRAAASVIWADHHVESLMDCLVAVRKAGGGAKLMLRHSR